MKNFSYDIDLEFSSAHILQRKAIHIHFLSSPFCNFELNFIMKTVLHFLSPLINNCYCHNLDVRSALNFLLNTIFQFIYL